MVKRPPGRPPLDEKSATPSAGVHVKISAADYDRADKLRKTTRESIQDLIRRGLKRILDECG